ncbi:EcsC family protein [Aestuariicoccus sp. MJ-SS9]|uniref:EcsC family protein n=1 Tax=Aestuariicoccus sp. MJ-SS9 TaxID=3079855 RepID=UPI00290D6F77|nr:EcsC family protein [Aestuariicoccus sp. MJ-SS9]MDU8910536.1 EcsC family protein [Aestuariicoccus sp. MJ-SS9]
MSRDAPTDPRTLPRDAVRRALDAQRAYERRRQTLLGKGAERLTEPVGGLFARAVPPALVRMGLRAADRAAGLTLPAEITSHDINDPDACEAAARRVQAWAVGTNAATGGAAGWFGAAGLTADIPATIALAARNVRATGAAWGFAADSEAERAFRLMVLELASTHAEKTRRETLGALDGMARVLETPAGRMMVDKGGEWVTEKVIERVLRQMGVSLGSRKAAQVVPVIGGAVAAVVNASFQTDVSRAARYSYRLRWLMSRNLLPAPEPAATTDTEAGA